MCVLESTREFSIHSVFTVEKNVDGFIVVVNVFVALNSSADLLRCQSTTKLQLQVGSSFRLRNSREFYHGRSL
jgi:hypothetical protein